MTCQDLVDFLLDYFEGELPAPQRARFDEHVKLCPECRHYLSTYEQCVDLVRAACEHPDDPVPRDVPPELVEAILRAARG